jgi:hypothetical protein
LTLNYFRKGQAALSLNTGAQEFKPQFNTQASEF